MKTSQSHESSPTLLLTVREVAHLLSIGPKKVYELINQRQIKSLKIGRSRRFTRKALEEFIDQESH